MSRIVTVMRNRSLMMEVVCYFLQGGWGNCMWKCDMHCFVIDSQLHHNGRVCSSVACETRVVNLGNVSKQFDCHMMCGDNYQMHTFPDEYLRMIYVGWGNCADFSLCKQ